jgi:hypothetical protein
MIDCKLTHLGCFDDEEAAARAYDQAATPLGRPMNFPSADGGVFLAFGVSAVKGGRGGTSHFKGVRWYKKASKWQAQITHDEAAARVGRRVNFSAAQPGGSMKRPHGDIAPSPLRQNQQRLRHDPPVVDMGTETPRRNSLAHRGFN